MSDTPTVCERCGEEYDPDRDPEVPGADTSRCPACGARPYELPEGDGEKAPDAEAAVDAANLRVELQVHVHRGGEQ